MHGVLHLTAREVSMPAPYYLKTFMFSTITLAFLWFGTSFQQFRNNYRITQYLLIPATLAEKFLVELFFRLLIFVFSFPLIFWIGTNITEIIIHLMFKTESVYIFMFDFPENILRKGLFSAILTYILFLVAIPFLCSAWFKRLPLVKSILVIVILLALVWGLALFAIFGIDVGKFNPQPNRIYYGSENPEIIVRVLAIVASLVIFIASFYKIKEKEV